MKAEETTATSSAGAPRGSEAKSPTALRPANRQIVLWWQTALLLSPVVLLAVLGVRWLNMDRSVAREQAREVARWQAQGIEARLQGLADSLAGASSALARTPELQPQTTSWTVNDQGDLVAPPTYDANPHPFPLNIGVLPPEQLRLYEEGCRGEQSAASRPNAILAWQKLCEVGSPERLVPVVRYRLGALLLKERKLAEAIQAFAWVEEHAPRTLGESGLPLQPLARWQQLQIMRLMYPSNPADLTRVAAFCSNLVTRPSCLTSRLLSDVRELRMLQDVTTLWLAAWRRDEVARQMHSALRARQTRSSPNPLWEWVDLDTPWLVFRGGGTNRAFQAASLSRVQSQILLGGVAAVPSLPRYMGLEIRVADRVVVAPESSSEVLGRSPVAQSGSVPRSPFSVAIHLTNPAALFHAQRVRSLWLLGIILLASSGAILGTIALRRAYLKQAALTELKGNFVASVSHELRAPIASIRLLAEGLERGKVTEEPRRATYFRLIVQECRRLSSLIENVLDLSRIDQGRKQYEFEDVDLEALVRHTFQVMEPYAQERQVQMLLQPAATAPVLEADGRALQQALVNLIDNAIKHTPAQAQVSIGWNDVPAAGNGESVAWEVWVQDQGPGIPVSQQAKIFEPFYRRGSELRRETAGIGIGLTIVKHVVDAHQGTIRIESGEGKGSRFILRLPTNLHHHESPPQRTN